MESKKSNYYKLGKDVHNIIFGYYIVKEHKTRKNRVLIKIKNHIYDRMYNGPGDYVKHICRDLDFKVSIKHLFDLLFSPEMYWIDIVYHVRCYEYEHWIDIKYAE